VRVEALIETVRERASNDPDMRKARA